MLYHPNGCCIGSPHASTTPTMLTQLMSQECSVAIGEDALELAVGLIEGIQVSLGLIHTHSSVF